jgi:hypothetical protein
VKPAPLCLQPQPAAGAQRLVRRLVHVREAKPHIVFRLNEVPFYLSLFLEIDAINNEPRTS